MTDIQKTETEHLEKGDLVSVTHAREDGVMDLRGSERAKAERNLKWKLDIRLNGDLRLELYRYTLHEPLCKLIAHFESLHRNALASARLKGLEADLGLTDAQYRASLAILYASYSPLQLPSNLILNYISRPSIYISACVILWGLFSTLTGAVNGPGALLGLRFLVGAPEAAFYCGAMFMLSRWFTKREMAVRGALFYVGLLGSNAFGPLVAAGILGNMEGDLGHPAWRWVFFIEGAMTIFVGIVTMWLLPDWPHNCRWLSEEEKLLAQQRMAEDASAADEDLSGARFLHGLNLACKDKVVWLFVIATFLQIMGNSYTNFFPTLVGTLGYGSIETLLLTAPPWIFTCIVCVLNAWHADRVQERYWHLAWLWWACVIGYIIMIATQQTAARYVSLFLLCLSYAGFALTLVYVANAIPRPPAKRAATMGLVNGIGNLGNLCGSFIWASEYGPSYRIPAGICMASLIVAIFFYGVIRQILVAKNKKLANITEEELRADPEAWEEIERFAQLEGLTLSDAIEERKKFRFVH